MSVRVRAGVLRDQKKTPDSGAGVTGCCELCDVGAGN